MILNFLIHQRTSTRDLYRFQKTEYSFYRLKYQCKM
nr:MAG TPA: hypothetical protein [Caudoviricetes sp.]